ncbi:22196_t:CDS:2 [Cetraspora pellucida]|uniref:22196_t:CDS:1 n=1 Tax=Cetraspora pellucida TaxID=1433469 RepID=A0A9N9FND5_9GLOM|nr:22196_t:CDS:2 [Cetraspora pellucida]
MSEVHYIPTFCKNFYQKPSKEYSSGVQLAGILEFLVNILKLAYCSSIRPTILTSLTEAKTSTKICYTRVLPASYLVYVYF